MITFIRYFRYFLLCFGRAIFNWPASLYCLRYYRFVRVRRISKYIHQLTWAPVCHTLSLCVIPCHYVSYPVTMCHTLSLCVIPCHYVSYPVTMCHTLSLCVIPCHYVSYPVTMCHTLSLCVIPCHYVSYPVTMCHTLSLCVIPCHYVSYPVNTCHYMSCHVNTIMSCMIFHNRKNTPRSYQGVHGQYWDEGRWLGWVHIGEHTRRYRNLHDLRRHVLDFNQGPSDEKWYLRIKSMSLNTANRLKLVQRKSIDL